MTRDEWLAQIEANPGNWQMALIAADEIESDGDELFAEQLRFAVQFNRAWVAGCGVEFDLVDDLRSLRNGEFTGIKYGSSRSDEREWCEKSNVRFIPAFPRSLEDVYAGRELV